MAEWYYAQGGNQQGPISTDALRQKIASGEVGAQDMVWREGMGNWQPASAVPELAGGGQAAAYQQPVQQQPVQQQPQYGYNPQAGGYGAPQAPQYGGGYGAGQSFAKDAQTAMILSIIGLLCCGILGIIGLIQGNKAKKNMQMSGNFEGQGMATAAVVMGWIAIAFMIIGVVFQIINIAANA